MFIIFINAIHDVVAFSNTLLFADDIKCFKSNRSDLDSHNLQDDLDSLANWSKICEI